MCVFAILRGPLHGEYAESDIHNAEFVLGQTGLLDLGM